MTGWLLVLASCIVLTSIGCEAGLKSGRGLRLPEGDIARGELAFRDLGCQSCHDVVGVARPEEGERADVIVALGGKVTRVETYGELVTSIVNPSHELSGRYPKDQVSEDGRSKMEDFNEKMTVAQLIDLTAFLQSKYERRPEPLYIP